MNQAIVVCLWNIAAIYTSIVFYIKFGEKVECIKGVGMGLVITCVVFLCIEGAEKSNETVVDPNLPFDLSQSGYAFMAVLCGLAVPICFSYKAVYFRLSMSQYKYDCTDLSIDGQLLEHFILTVIYVVYIVLNGFDLNELLIGSFAAITIVIGGVTCARCFALGPAGPVQSIFSTQIIYQVILNYFFFG